MLKRSDINRLNRARDTLAAVQVACQENRHTESSNWRDADAFSFGIVSEAADAAGNALFNLLNLMNAHRVQEFSDADLFNREVVDND